MLRKIKKLRVQKMRCKREINFKDYKSCLNAGKIENKISFKR